MSAHALPDELAALQQRALASAASVSASGCGSAAAWIVGLASEPSLLAASGPVPDIALLEQLAVTARTGRTPGPLRGPEGAPHVLAVLPLRSAAGAVLGALAIADAEDRTLTPREHAFVHGLAEGAAAQVDLAQRARALASAHTELERAEELREHVIGMVGHDLRDPLNAIVLATSLLQRAGLGPREVRNVERIASSAEHMSRIIRNTLEFVRARRGRLELEREPVDVAAEVRAVAFQLEAAYPGRIEVAARGDCTAHLDKGRCGQVIQNLLGNALKHGAADQPVRVECEGSPAEIVVRVHNGGAPIAPALLPRIFEPFQHGPGRHGREGSLGLGLFIVDEIVRAHGGRVAARSTAEDGTTFTVALPRQ